MLLEGIYKGSFKGIYKGCFKGSIMAALTCFGSLGFRVEGVGFRGV